MVTIKCIISSYAEKSLNNVTYSGPLEHVHFKIYYNKILIS